ncbi:peptidoglycan-binding domain-containing protein [Streptomyces mayteni]
MSVPPEGERGAERPAIEPTHVMMRRRSERLAELLREMDSDRDADEDYETVPVPPAPEPATEELPKLPGADRGRRTGRAAVAVAVVAAALVGFGGALLVSGGETGETKDEAPPSAEVPTERAVDPDGPGTLREGDAGPEVVELQRRLRDIPNVYENGSVGGEYDATLTEAVARFQLWYGIRGDETGVYGDDTRLDLESRTGN